MIPLVISVVSLILSVTVAWLTLFRRGTLGMTQPMLVGFLHEGEQAKIFYRTMLYATGKRGRIIEALYLRVKHRNRTEKFDFWMYGETKDLKIGSGLRVGEDGVSFNHHFLPSKDAPSYEFLAGEYTIELYAAILNRLKPVLLSAAKLPLSEEQAAALSDPVMGVLFTWNPDSRTYRGNVSEPPPGEGRSRSVSGAGRGKFSWN